MKVISGSLKGKSLKTLKGLDIRPTPNKVKEALFNILGDKIVDARFLDLFAGAGSVGIEALSRGAGEVLFVENDKKAVQLIKENLERCGIKEQCDIVFQNGIDFLKAMKKNPQKFDLIFLDPPYHTSSGESAMEEIGKADILAKDGLVILEHFHKMEIKETHGILKRYRERRFGDTCLSFFNKEQEER